MPQTLLRTTTEHRVVPSAKLRQQLFAGDAFGTTLFVWALDAMGPGLVGAGEGAEGPWEPETVLLEARDRLGAPLPAANANRLLAAVAVVATDRPWLAADAFVHVANTLSGSPATAGAWDPADVDECAWAVTEMMLLVPPDKGSEPFGPDVRAYVQTALKHWGYSKPPQCLAFLAPATQSEWASALSDSPDLAEAISQDQYAKAQAVDDAVVESLERLVGQVEALPLAGGRVESLRQRLAGAKRP